MEGLMKKFLALTLLLGFVTPASFASKNQIPPIPKLAVGDAVPGEYIVKLKPHTDFDVLSLDSVGRVLGGVVASRFDSDPNLLVVKKDLNIETVYTELYKSDLVEYVEPNYIYRTDLVPNDPDYAKTWGLKNDNQSGVDINVEKAWDITTGSDDVVVAIIDSGADLNHPELRDNIWVNEKELNGKPGVDDDGNGYIDDVHGYNFAEDKPEPIDDNGHGSHVAGVIAAKGNNGEGLAGINWNVKIMPLKFITKEGTGSAESAIKAIDYAISKNVKIISNSWGGSGASLALKEAVQRAADHGILFIASAGNNGLDNDTSPHYPSNFYLPNIISVAALGKDGALPDFSNYGLTRVNVAAPGVEIYSTYKDGGYETMSGTSMATPHVAGVAALVLAAHPKFSLSELREKMMSSVKSLDSLKGKISTGGMIDAFKAVQ
jgi:thermitase